jgi:hypothetical protein
MKTLLPQVRERQRMVGAGKALHVFASVAINSLRVMLLALTEVPWCQIPLPQSIS